MNGPLATKQATCPQPSAAKSAAGQILGGKGSPCRWRYWCGRPTVALMTEPPRPAGEQPPNYSMPGDAPASGSGYTMPTGGAGDEYGQPATGGPGGYPPPPTSGAGGYAPPPGGGGGYAPPPTSGAG